MFLTRMLLGLGLLALASSAASAAGESSLVAEGLTDPARLGAKAAGKSPQEIDGLLLSQAAFDAATHLGLYTRGLQFKQQPGPDGQYAFATAGAEFQKLYGLSPETKTLRMLKSGLALASVTYGPDSIERLNLAKDFFSLPIYRVKGEYQNSSDAVMTKAALHWKAVGDAYHQALVEHLAKLYPGKEIASVSGRVYPVRVIEAELLPVAEPAPPGAATASSANSAASASSAAPATGTAAPLTAASAASATAAAPFDSKQYIYRVEMEVRLSIRPEDVKFAEEKPATSATSAGSAASAVSAASATSAVPAAAK